MKVLTVPLCMNYFSFNPTAKQFINYKTLNGNYNSVCVNILKVNIHRQRETPNDQWFNLQTFDFKIL